MKRKQDLLDAVCVPLTVHSKSRSKCFWSKENLLNYVHQSKCHLPLLMFGNDGSCVLRKGFLVHTAQTVLSNGMFSEENPVSLQYVCCELNCEQNAWQLGELIAVTAAAKQQFPLLITKRKHLCLMLKIVLLLAAVAPSHAWYFIIISYKNIILLGQSY